MAALASSRAVLLRTGAAAVARRSVAAPRLARIAALSTATTTSNSPRAPAAFSFLAAQSSFSPASRRFASSSAAPETPLRKTALYDLHVANGAKMVPFGGYYMPVQYDGLSVGDSHKFTREKASIFDVGHMVQRHFTGAGAAAFLETLTPSGIEALAEHRSTLSAFLWEKGGGIVDDTIITRLGPEHFYVVTNAACRDKDDDYLTRWLNDANLRKRLPGPVYHEELVDWGLVALQGPLAKDILAETLADVPDVDNLDKVYFGSSFFGRLSLGGGAVSSPLLISRGGYTGEDGFEIRVPPSETVAVTEALLGVGTPERVQLAGLGARDSLRLEAGLCLYGHDLDDTTTVVEAGLGWIVPKARHNDYSFHSAETVLGQMKSKFEGGMRVARRRIGLIVDQAPAREGADIIEGGDAPNPVIGRVTSGCPSPTLGKNIAMGYIKEGLHVSGTEVAVVVRGKPRRAVVTKMPFVPTKYHRAPKAPKKK